MSDYLKVGNYIPANKEHKAIIEREFYNQGMVFKDEEAFYEHPDQACYISELFDNVYTRKDFMELAEGNVKIAEAIFAWCDWASPESVFEDMFACNEFTRCPECNELVYVGDQENVKCEHCKTEFFIPFP